MFGFGKKKAAGGGGGIDWPAEPTLDDLIALGAYRRLDGAEIAAVREEVFAAFPDFAGLAEIFGTDWLGRVFAEQGDGGTVLLLEPGTAEVLEIPVDIAEFEASELVDNPDAALAWGFYQSWRNAGGAAPGPGQCIGYRKPLFLGGPDTFDNLELVDLSVYWSVTAQIIAQVRARGG